MGNGINKHGLKRSDLSAEIKRQLRQEAGFGCVVCGNAIGDYEHIEPEFAEALAHDPQKMAYLCIQCHGKVTRGQLSKATVLVAKNNPKAKQKGFSFEHFDVGNCAPIVRFGPVRSIGCNSVISVNDKPIFWVKQPEENNGPYRFGAELRNDKGEIIFRIDDNVWMVNTTNWDFQIAGQLLTLRNAPREISLIIKTLPPSELIVERLTMNVEGYELTCINNEFTVQTPSGMHLFAEKLECKNCNTAINIKEESISIGSGGGSALFSGSIGHSKADNWKIPLQGISRNSPCPCNSGKKYKHCCGAINT